MSDVPDVHEQIEERVREAFQAQDLDAAATVFIQQYGGEILAFLIGRLRGESDAAEVFSDFAEDFWRGLPGFQWRTSLRSWAYTLARNAANRYATAPHRKPARNIPLSQKSRFTMEVERLRSATRRHLRTEVKSKMRELRERLSEEDQTLLILRVDRQLSWRELAGIMSGQGEGMDDAELDRWSARLRQRFQVIKERLRDLAKAEGLLAPEER